MKILVDTCIWSMALRRKTVIDDEIVERLKELILVQRVQMIGAIRQELLSGIKTEKSYENLKTYLQAFPDLELETKDYEMAAKFFNICRSNGIQGSNTDFLICAIARNRKMPIFTVDKDFYNFQKFLPIELF